MQIQDLIKGQYDALKIWKRELRTRFSEELLKLPITDIDIRP